MLLALLSRYRPNSKFATHLFESLQYLVDSKSLDIIAGDFDIHRFLKEGLQDAITDYSQMA